MTTPSHDPHHLPVDLSFQQRQIAEDADRRAKDAIWEESQREKRKFADPHIHPDIKQPQQLPEIGTGYVKILTEADVRRIVRDELTRIVNQGVKHG